MVKGMQPRREANSRRDAKKVQDETLANMCIWIGAFGGVFMKTIGQNSSESSATFAGYCREHLWTVAEKESAGRPRSAGSRVHPVAARDRLQGKMTNDEKLE